MGHVDRILLASEREIGGAVVRLFEDEQIMAEPSGAISIAPLINGELDVQGKRVVCIISGGNMSEALFKEILDSELS